MKSMKTHQSTPSPMQVDVSITSDFLQDNFKKRILRQPEDRFAPVVCAPSPLDSAIIQALTSTIMVHVQSSYFIRFFNFLLNNNFVVLYLWLYSLAAV